MKHEGVSKREGFSFMEMLESSSLEEASLS